MPDNFTIFKNNNKKKESQPDYIISFKDPETGDYEEWGAGWIKQGKAGSYISCSKRKEKKQEDNTNLDRQFEEMGNQTVDDYPENTIGIGTDDIPF